MNNTIVVISLEPWDEVWRRNQYLVHGLLTSRPNLEVLFVEPPADPLYEIRSGQRPQVGAGLKRADHSGRLFAYQPTKWLPRVVGRMADQLLFRQVRSEVRRLGWHRPVLWINDPRWAGMMVWTGWPTLYDITDDWVVSDRVPREHARLRQGERILLERSEEVVVCSPALAETKGAFRDVTLVPNAVDVERYQHPSTRPIDLPAPPVALYAGTMHEDRLDVELVLKAARGIDAIGGRMVFVGPVAMTTAHEQQLRSEPNITLLGARPHTAMPAYLAHADVLIVPHARTPFTESLDPIKLYEYLASGRPVVSTSVARIRDFADEPGVTIADGAEFVEQVRSASRVSSRNVHRRAVPDWHERVIQFATVIDRLA